MTRPAVAVACLMLLPGCAGWSDPAVRFAQCVEAAIEEHARDGAAIRATCDLEAPGSHLVVLHPGGALREAQLTSAGLPEALLPELRTLRLGESPAIYVIATDPGVSGEGAARSIRSSSTTSQMHFVQIDKVMVLATTQPVRIDIGGAAERRVIEGLH